MSIQFSEAMESYGADVLQENTTVNLDNSMSASEIQALIDAQPKNLGGNTLTFQFADGTYTLDSQLTFQNFYNGTVFLQGNVADNSMNISKNVHLDFSGSDIWGVYFINCDAKCDVYYFKITINSSNNYRAGLYFYRCSSDNFTRYNYILGTSTNKGYGIFSHWSNMYIGETYVSNINMGIRAEGGNVASVNNDDTSTLPAYGLFVKNCGIIGKNGTQPSGSIANETESNGGLII